MADQYKANAKIKMGGAGSGNLNKGARGPIKTNFTGNTMVARVLFQAIGEPVPGKASPCTGNSRTSDPKRELEIN